MTVAAGTNRTAAYAEESMTVSVSEGLDAGAPWHFGDPLREQRLLESGERSTSRTAG